jgi:hypothetical protein
MQTICGKEIKVDPGVIRIARVAEGYESVDDPEALVSALRQSGLRIDLFTFIQSLHQTTPKHECYATEMENLAALPVTTFDHWWTHQIKSAARNKVRKAEKAGVIVREVPFDDDLIHGISAINNETPIRQGRKFLHYGDDLETIARKNGSFLNRAVFLGVFFEESLIGYAKLVSDETHGQAGLMQITSMIRHRDKAPNNMLIAQAVRSCAERGIPYLWYANFSYGKKVRDGLSDFKEFNGFQRVDLPRYYIPLTMSGRVALNLHLHHGLRELIPYPLLDWARNFRNAWNAQAQPGSN